MAWNLDLPLQVRSVANRPLLIRYNGYYNRPGVIVVDTLLARARLAYMSCPLHFPLCRPPKTPNPLLFNDRWRTGCPRLVYVADLSKIRSAQKKQRERTQKTIAVLDYRLQEQATIAKRVYEEITGRLVALTRYYTCLLPVWEFVRTSSFFHVLRIPVISHKLWDYF